jgi:hypothetical protein
MLGHPSNERIPDKPILNFGCGLNFLDGVNSDLFPLHRYILGGRRPDIFLSGTSAPKSLHNRFEVIICEHVLEHVLPVAGHGILTNLAKMLKPNGQIQLSVPSPLRYVSNVNGVININTVGLNNNIYNYGHRFMYDPITLSQLMESAGFCNIEINSYETSPYKHLLVQNREPASIYLIGTRP